MAIARFLSIRQLCFERNSFGHLPGLLRSFIPVRNCPSFVGDAPTWQLGDFQKDLKPYLKGRKKQNLDKRPQKVYYNEEPIIKCKDEKKNHYRDQKYNQFKPIPLVSENWKSYKSVGDHFTINIYTKDYTVPNSVEVKFEDSSIRPEIVNILSERNIEVMSPVQKDAIPKIAMGFNTMIAGEAGCGKTLAYLLPIIEHVLNWKSSKEDCYNAPFVIILTPSRELAEQIQHVIRWFEPLNIKAHVLMGSNFHSKIFQPKVDDIDFLVSTVGAIAKFIATGVYSLKNVRHIVLDEADVLLDDSFNENTIRFLKRFRFRSGPSEIESGTQITLVSATLPTSLSDLLGEIIEVDFFEKITTPNLHKTMPHVPQKFLRVNRSTKPAYMLQIAKANYKNKKPLIVFCNNTEACNWLSVFLQDNGVPNINLNGEMMWKIRRDRFKKFQNGEFNVLVCTSVAARGLDTCRAQHVVNYDFPSFIADYIHRCGRTGRLGSKVSGQVTNLISSKNEIVLVQKVEKSVRMMTEFENVNANIKRIIRFRGVSSFERRYGIDKFEAQENNDSDDDEEEK